ncbi:hypothetical protein [Bacillus carboniphilus]
MTEYDEKGNIVNAKLSYNGSGYSNGDAKIDFLMHVNPNDLESVQ